MRGRGLPPCLPMGLIRLLRGLLAVGGSRQRGYCLLGAAGGRERGAGLCLLRAAPSPSRQWGRGGGGLKRGWAGGRRPPLGRGAVPLPGHMETAAVGFCCRGGGWLPLRRARC